MTKEDMMPAKPNFTREISFGQVIQIGVLLVGFVVAFTQVKGMAEKAADDAKIAAAERGQMELRIRALETQQARADERFSNILSYLARIDSRLERIENK